MAAAGERLRVAVSGMVAGEPGQGGASWSVLQYVLGLRRLGHEVVLVEPVEEAAAEAGSASARYLEEVAGELGTWSSPRWSEPTAGRPSGSTGRRLES